MYTDLCSMSHGPFSKICHLLFTCPILTILHRKSNTPSQGKMVCVLYSLLTIWMNEDLDFLYGDLTLCGHKVVYKIQSLNLLLHFQQQLSVCQRFVCEMNVWQCCLTSSAIYIYIPFTVCHTVWETIFFKVTRQSG